MKDFTSGSILSHLLTMAAPLFAGLILMLVCGLVDLYFVADLGESAIAGVGAAGNAAFAVNAMTQVVSVGTLAIVSQAVGRKDRASANSAFLQSLLLSSLFAACTLLCGFALAGPYMKAVAADASTITDGTIYLIWFLPALTLQFILQAILSALRGVGLAKPSMYVQALIVGINIALAPILILGWGTQKPMGVAGAGLASSLAVAVGVIAAFVYLLNVNGYLRLNEGQPKFNFAYCRRILKIGLPASGEFAIMFIYMAVIYHALGSVGPSAQAGFSIGSRVLGLIQVPAMAIAFASAAIVGQNVGALDLSRVKQVLRVVLITTSAVMLAATIVTQWQSASLLHRFTSDAQAIAEGDLFLRMVSLNLFAQGIIFVCSSAFQGLGNTRPQLISSTVRLISYVFPTLWLSAQPSFSSKQMWYLSIATTTAQAIVSLWLLRRELGKFEKR
ncbi:putative MATE family efflux protein [Bradyrhizobium sp. AZCC 1588]|uniref:MATE family efflux transporter n=1 Tax=unclassified Bradyrhizobium TaxID=2631580 RepID=UPI002FF04B68